MKKIENAFAKKDKNFYCFGCSPYNSYGLKLEFFKDDNKFFCEWEPESKFDGWQNIVHGGIQSTIIDETAEWYIFANYGRSAVTMELNVKFLKPLYSNKGKIKVFAEESFLKRNIAEIKIKIVNAENITCTEATGKFFVYDEKTSKEKFNFPDLTDF